MNSYEGDWDPVPSTVTSFAPVLPPNPNHGYIVPNGTTLLEAQEAARQKPSRPKEKTSSLPDTYRPGLQSLLPVRASIINGIIQPYRREEVQHVQRQALELESFKLYQANRESPNDIYWMENDWAGLLKKLPSGKKTAEEYAKDRIAEISCNTDAFILVPEKGDTVFRIWGTSEQVEKAKVSLDVWDRTVRMKGGRKVDKGLWDKSGAVDGREQDRLMRELHQQEQFKTFQQFAPDIIFQFESILIWPEGYDFEGFIEDYEKIDSKSIDALRQQYQCHIEHVTDGPVRYTRIGCDDEKDVKAVYLRLMGLVKEMVSRKKRGMKAVHCHLPSFDVARESIKTVKTQIGVDYAYVPFMIGEQLQETERVNWQKLVDFSHKQYRLAMKQAVKTSLGSLYFSQRHARMRVSFGSMALHSYRRPENGDEYDLEEFLAKVKESGVMTKQLPCFAGTNYAFMDYIDEKLGQPTFSWDIQFKFESQSSGVLMLEKEYSHNVEHPDEPSVSATRWLDFTPTEDIEKLQLDCFDFEKPGYQIHIGAVPLFTNEKVMNSLASFENNIVFKPSPDGLRFIPTKHAVYPPRGAELTKVDEITIAKYEYGKGILEIRRRDAWNTFLGKKVNTTWSASYYYPHWDNKMADFANIQPGQDVEWQRELKTFFPKNGENTTRASSGFKDFMKEIENVQALLGEALKKREENGNRLGGQTDGDGNNGHVNGDQNSGQHMNGQSNGGGNHNLVNGERNSGQRLSESQKKQ